MDHDHPQGIKRNLSWSVAIPVFLGASADKVNGHIRASVEDRITKTRHEVQASDPRREITGSGTVSANDGRTAQVAIDYADYLAGTAHPTAFLDTTVVDISDGNPVTLDRVFTHPPAALRALRPWILKLVAAAGEVVDPQAVDPASATNGLAPQQSNWAAWQTSSAGMSFYFQDYQLGGHGIRMYTVPWSVVSPLMSPASYALVGVTSTMG